MKKRLLLYFGGVGLLLFLLLILSKLLYPPPPIAKTLFDILPDSPAFSLHCPDVQTRLKDFTLHEQYQRLLHTPGLQRLLRSEEGRARLTTLEGFLEDKLLSPMQLLGKEVSFALYRSSGKGNAQPRAILLSRVSEKAKLAERVFYALDWLTEIGVEKLPQKLRQHSVYQVRQQDLSFPLYYVLISDLALVSSSLELLETTIARLSDETPEPEGNVLTTPARRVQPEHRFVTAFADLSELADELSTTLFFRDFYLANRERVESMKAAPPLFSTFDIYPESIRLQVDVPPRFPKERSDSRGVEHVANTCWDKSGQLGQFPLLLDISPNAFRAFWGKLRESFPKVPDWQDGFAEDRIWDTAIECRVAAKPVGKLYALPDLFCVSDSLQPPEESIAAIDSVVNGILDEQVPPMLRRTMLRQERTSYKDVSVNTLQVMFQDVFSYAALTNGAGEAFNMLASNSAAVTAELDAIRNGTGDSAFYCRTAPREHMKVAVESGELIPAAGLWVHADRAAYLLEDISTSKSFELLLPRKKNPEFYRQLPQLQLFLRSLPPLYLEFGLQEDIPTVNLWSQGYTSKSVFEQESHGR